MRVVIDGKPQAEFAAEQERAINVMREVETAEGRVLSADEATQAYATWQKTVFLALAAIMLALTMCLSYLARPDDRPLALAVIAAANVA